jgi:hypothetical protein
MKQFLTFLKPISSSHHPDRVWGLSSLLQSGLPGALSLGIQRPVREADHSHPSYAEDRNGGAISPFPIRLHGVMLN